MSQDADTTPQPLPPQPNTTFDWLIYADATFAGLSVLIPIPIIDWIFENIFRIQTFIHFIQ